MAETLFQFRYRKEFGLTVEEYEREPWEAKWQAGVLWELEAEKERLEQMMAEQP